MSRTTRRHLIRQGLGLSLAAALPAGLIAPRLARAGESAAASDKRVLVVLQLGGGNDGLSTVVPYEDDALYRLRRATAIKKNEVVKLSDQIGLHPKLAPLEAHWKRGNMAIVQGVGYADPTRSHFKSMDIWHAADRRGRNQGTGWLSRAADTGYAQDNSAELLVNLGSQVPFALTGGTHKAISFQDPASYRWLGRKEDKGTFDELNKRGRAADMLARLRRTADDARASSKRIRAAAAAYTPKVTYPGQSLATDLKLVAGLIQADLSTRVYYVSLGGFDTHTGQRGRHENLMANLGESVAAFLSDLEAGGVADRVTVMAFSEFGRRPKENGSGGTDHGTAGPMFLFGKPVKGGLHGAHPSLTELDGNRDLKFTTDFRSVYATVLDTWLGIPSKRVLGKTYAGLPLFA